jgi:hypothetical protein
MRPIGFSTGSLMFSSHAFDDAAEILAFTNASAIEFSALREHELAPLIAGVPKYLRLLADRRITFHAPSKIELLTEAEVIDQLLELSDGYYSIVVHPNVIDDFEKWKIFGSRLMIENMDSRKDCAQTADQMHKLFEELVEARLCLDIGHAIQVGFAKAPSNKLQVLEEFLDRFKNRLGQIHWSEVNCIGMHAPPHHDTYVNLIKVRDKINRNVPIICEFSCYPHEINGHVEIISRILGD